VYVSGGLRYRDRLRLVSYRACIALIVSGALEDGIMHPAQFMRRKDAAQYLVKTYGFGAERTLAKGVVTGDSPEFRKAGRIVLYTREALDQWACAKIGAPQRSTSDSRSA